MMKSSSRYFRDRDTEKRNPVTLQAWRTETRAAAEIVCKEAESELKERETKAEAAAARKRTEDESVAERKRVEEAENAVERYRAEKNLVAASGL